MTKLLRLTLTNFRNYDRFVWSPEQQKVVVFGPNGSGKTNLLEALSFLVPGKGLRKSRIEEVCRKDSQHGWGVIAKFSHPYMDEVEIATGCPSDSIKRQFRVNGNSARNQYEISQYLSAIWLTPQMDRLFLEGASGRRRFLDRLIMSIETYHTKEVVAYEKSISQRNKLLSIQNFDTGWLNAIEESMARHAVAITAARANFIQKFNDTSVIEGTFPEATLKIICPIADYLQQKPALIVEDYLKQQWKTDRLIDAKNRSMRLGIHKADIIFIEKKTQISASMASTGQQKALLIGIILKLTEMIKKQNTTLPLLLLDEPLVHLDEFHRKILLSTLLNLDGFIILSGTDKETFEQCSGQAEFLQINQGKMV